jgi:plastocyanin
MSVHVRQTRAFAVAAALAVTFAACGGGGYNQPTSPSPGGGSVGATITITANGVSPKEVDIVPGQTVRFVNNDNRVREMLSTPHLVHDDCPPTNSVGSLQPGANRNTGTFQTLRICGFHDHQNPDDNRFRGQINVGTREGPAPGYSSPW